MKLKLTDEQEQEMRALAESRKIFHWGGILRALYDRAALREALGRISTLCDQELKFVAPHKPTVIVEIKAIAAGERA